MNNEGKDGSASDQDSISLPHLPEPEVERLTAWLMRHALATWKEWRPQAGGHQAWGDHRTLYTGTNALD